MSAQLLERWRGGRKNLEGVLYNPSIDVGGELITLCSRQEFIWSNAVAVQIDHSQQEFESARTRVLSQLHDRLSFHAEAILRERVTQIAHDRDVLITTDDAAIGVLINLHAATSTILCSFARHLGRSHRVRKR